MAIEDESQVLITQLEQAISHALALADKAGVSLVGVHLSAALDAIESLERRD